MTTSPKTTTEIRKRSARAVREDIRELTTRRGIPARPLLKVLPIRRVIPQDLHSLGDYGDSVRVMIAGLLTPNREARAASLALGLSGVTASMLTDYRLAPVKVIPIEVHEAIDYLWGAAAIAAPFVLGYRKKAPITATFHMLTGAVHIVSSMLTDYRAARGIGHEEEPERIGVARMQESAT
jgi:hypothetical protein